jgi:thiamine-phosphate pyrophosphorylase
MSDIPQMSNIPLYRILDANLDRAREGLRVIEEWCRFGLNNAELAGLCKQLRQELGSWHRNDFRLARDTPADIGTEITHSHEESRADIAAVLQANLSRVQEALRVLEEYGKVYSSAMGLACKHMRYQVYTLESQLLLQDRRQRLQETSLYLITAPMDNLDEIVEAALQAGVRLVQYRDKDPDDPVRLTRARSLRLICQRYQALFIVNDRVDLALAVDADGVHLGQQDLPVETARQLLGPYRLIGRSTTNPAELKRAMEEDVDYVGVGPVFATPTKADKAVAGLDYVRYAAVHSTLPWFAIGGIDCQNLPQVIQAGAQRVAIVRAIMQADHPGDAVQQALASLQSSQ